MPSPPGCEAELFAGVFAYPRLQLVRGEGCFVWDSDGQKYLDFTAGLGVLALGHGRHELAEIMAQQFVRLGHCSNLFANQPAQKLAQMLRACSFAERIWLACSGTEVIEAALKFARVYGQAHGGAHKHGFIAFERGFHGRTMGALSITYEPAYRLPFAPVMPGVQFAKLNDLASVARVMHQGVCAVIVEPVQGEGGVHVAEPQFLQGLRQLCDDHHALLVFDEIQAGLGRTGKLFAYEHSQVVPDMLALAKPLGGGLPIGALLLNAKAADGLRAGQHGSTFGGGPTVCAVAVAMLEALAQPELLAGVAARGAQLQAGLERLCARYDFVAGQRGLGLMRALCVAHDAPAGQRPLDIVTAARSRGLLVTRAGDDAVRFLPPLNCSAQHVDAALEILDDALRSVS